MKGRTPTAEERRYLDWFASDSDLSFEDWIITEPEDGQSLIDCLCIILLMVACSAFVLSRVVIFSA